MAQRLFGPERAEVSVHTAQLLELTERDGQAPATIQLLAHREELMGPFLGWAAALARSGLLSPRHHELLAMRASHLCGSPYEWNEHAEFARDAGLTEAEIEAIATGAGAWSDDERLLLDAADALVGTGRIDDALYGKLAAHFSTGELVEIPLVVGQYTMLSMMCGFFEVPGNSAAGASP